MADEKETGFKVSDRRMFNPDGSLRDSDPEKEKAEPVSHASSEPNQIQPNAPARRPYGRTDLDKRMEWKKNSEPTPIKSRNKRAKVAPKRR